MTDCFQTIIGLSDRDCDCFETGRPNGDEATLAENRLLWQSQKFTCPDTPPDPYTITATYSLPADTTIVSLQLFGGGQLLEEGLDFEVTGDKVITITTPIPGQTYQLLYQAITPTAVSVPAYTESMSGLYITDLLPEEEIKGLEGCDKTIWDVISKARETAIKDFKGALNATLAQRYKVKYNTFKGFVGSDKNAGTLSTANQYAGIRIRTAGMRSGYLKITRIMTMFSAVGTITATVYKARIMDEATGDTDLEVVVPAFTLSTANGPSITNVNIELPLLGDFSDCQDYLLVYEYDAGNAPRLNKLYCQPCSGNTVMPIDYNANNYPSLREYPAKIAWHNFFMIGGWEGDLAAGQTEIPAQATEYLNGMSLEVEAGCDMSAGLCGMVETFGANPFAMGVATAIQRRAAAILMRKRLSSSQPNRNNAVNREGIEKEVRTWEAEYLEVVNYLSSNMPETANDCLECKPRVRTGGILG